MTAMLPLTTASALERFLRAVPSHCRQAGALMIKDYRRAYRLYCTERHVLNGERRHASTIDFDCAAMEAALNLMPDFKDSLLLGDEERAAELAMEIAKAAELAIYDAVNARVEDMLTARDFVEVAG